MKKIICVIISILLALGDDIVIYVVQMGFELVDLRLSYGKAEVHLGSCQSDPEPAPCLIARIGGKEPEHIGRRVARGKRGFVFVGHGNSPE